MKVLIYKGEKNEIYGFKRVNFDINPGVKVKIEDKLVTAFATVELGEFSFNLFKREFSSCKDWKANVEDKCLYLYRFALDYSGVDGEKRAGRILGVYDNKLSNAIERVLEKLEQC